MAGQFQSLKTFIRDFFINFFVSVIVGILFGFRNIWMGFILSCILFVIGIGFLILKRYERFLKVLWSGAHGFYYSFPVEENKRVWEKVNQSFRYLGVSSDSIIGRFKDWVESLPENAPHKFYFLLMDPVGTALIQQIAHQRALDPTHQQVIQEIEPIKNRILSSIEILKRLEIYKEGRLEIRVYDEFIPWWMYVLDEEEIFLGILPKGKSGLDSPLLIIKENKKYTTLFNAFMSTWDRMWSSARKV